MTLAPTRRVTRESTEWVGPIDVQLHDTDGNIIPQDNVQFAVVSRGPVRAVDADFNPPDMDPQGSGALGVLVNPVGAYSWFGIWARDANNPETIWLQPAEVGWILRT